MLDPKQKMLYLLRDALLQGGHLSREVYEDPLEDSIDRWHRGLQTTGGDFVFVVAEQSEEIAMVLIEANKRLYINGAARDKLAEIWSGTYETQLNYLLPLMAEDLAEGALSVTGVQHVG